MRMRRKNKGESGGQHCHGKDLFRKKKKTRKLIDNFPQHQGF